MDHFGIGAAITGSAHIYFRSARGTGRTVSMLDSLKDGDRIIFTNNNEAKRVEKLFKEDGKNVQCIVVDPQKPEQLLERGTGQGRTIFDHSWVEQFYINAIERCKRDINFFQRELSGYGEPHRETRRKAIELAKWQI